MTAYQKENKSLLLKYTLYLLKTFKLSIAFLTYLSKLLSLNIGKNNKNFKDWI